MSYRGVHVQIDLDLLECDGYALYVASISTTSRLNTMPWIEAIGVEISRLQVELKTIAWIPTHPNSIPDVVSVGSLCDE
jgi:hypothetical protein